MNQKNLFIFIGPPGSGKGSLSRLCVEQLGLTQLSTGFLCRKHIAEKTPIGKKIDLVINSGKLISDDMIIAMVQDWLQKHADSVHGIILDGFPRTRAQAEALQQLIAQKLPKFATKIVQLSIGHDTVMQRLLSRSMCQNQDCQAVYSTLPGSPQAPKQPGTCDLCGSLLKKRDDDEKAVIQKRLDDYKEQEAALLGFYREQGVSVEQLSVEQPLKAVFEEFKQRFDY